MVGNAAVIEIAENPIDPVRALADFESGVRGSGAIASFLGKVRDNAAGSEVRGLFLEHYPGVTEKSIEGIVRSAHERWPLDATLVIHRVGMVAAHEPIVFVCAASAHRRAAFEATDFLMDFLKTEALFWKKEVRSDGEVWIEPRSQDYLDANRWRND